MIEPPPPAAIAGTWYFAARKALVRLVSSVSRQPSAEIEDISPIAPRTPALLKAASRPPKRRTASLVSASCRDSSRTSPARIAASPPIAAISSASAASAFSFRAVTTTFAPSRAKSSAAARPIPELAPVMIAVFPSSLGIVLLRLILLTTGALPDEPDRNHPISVRMRSPDPLQPSGESSPSDALFALARNKSSPFAVVCGSKATRFRRGRKR